MNNFEATFLIMPEIGNNELSTINSKIEKTVKDEGGKIVGKEDWGLRNLSYRIKNFKKAFYSFYQIEIDNKKIQDLKNKFLLDEKIIRQLFIKVENHENLPTKIMGEKE